MAVEEHYRRSELRLCFWRGAEDQNKLKVRKPFGKEKFRVVRIFFHIVKESFEITPLSRTLLSPSYRFYINIFCRGASLK